MAYRYKRIRLSRNSTRDEHRLTMESVLGHRLSSDQVVHHINGDRKDNRLENLQVMTRREHAQFHLKGQPAIRFGEAIPSAKLTNALAMEVRQMLSDGWRIKDLAELLGVNRSTISRLKRGVHWKHVPATDSTLTPNPLARCIPPGQG